MDDIDWVLMEFDPPKKENSGKDMEKSTKPLKKTRKNDGNHRNNNGAVKHRSKRSHS